MGQRGEILEFQGQYRFLSNFWSVDICYEGKVYPSVEHAYQAAKVLDEAVRESICRCHTPRRAKQLGRCMPLRPGWEEMKADIMLELLRLKFAFYDLGMLLLATEDAVLEEGNWWGDTYWGVCPSGSGNGENMLGRLLMQVREELKEVLAPEEAKSGPPKTLRGEVELE